MMQCTITRQVRSQSTSTVGGTSRRWKPSTLTTGQLQYSINTTTPTAVVCRNARVHAGRAAGTASSGGLAVAAAGSGALFAGGAVPLMTAEDFEFEALEG